MTVNTPRTAHANIYPADPDDAPPITVAVATALALALRLAVLPLVIGSRAILIKSSIALACVRLHSISPIQIDVSFLSLYIYTTPQTSADADAAGYEFEQVDLRNVHCRSYSLQFFQYYIHLTLDMLTSYESSVKSLSLSFVQRHIRTRLTLYITHHHTSMHFFDQNFSDHAPDKNDKSVHIMERLSKIQYNSISIALHL